MDKNKGYQCSIEDIDKFIKYSQDAGYFWNDIVYTGGEPFLWKHWEEATNKLRESGVVGTIKAYTNGLWMKDRNEIHRRAEMFDQIILSKYPFNKEQVQISSGLVTPLGRDEFVIHAKHSFPDSIPAICGCRAYGLFDGTISLCTSMPFLAAIYNWDYKKMDGVAELQPNFLDYIDDSNVVKREICTWCFGNKRVSKHLDKIPNKI
jgi:hypothetical protein